MMPVSHHPQDFKQAFISDSIPISYIFSTAADICSFKSYFFYQLHMKHGIEANYSEFLSTVWKHASSGLSLDLETVRQIDLLHECMLADLSRHFNLINHIGVTK